MKIPLAVFALLFLVTPIVNAVPESMVQEDYVWQDRFNERFQAAQSGDAEAQYSIGEMFEKGSGVPIDLGRAFIWYERAAKQNHQKGRFKLAYMYYRGEGTEPNPGKAFQLMEKLAKSGYARAQYYLGLMYETGIFIKRDINLATTWYQRAAVGGYTPALMALYDLPQSIATLAPVEDGFGTQDAIVENPQSAPVMSQPANSAMQPPPETATLPGAVAPLNGLAGETARGANALPQADYNGATSPTRTLHPSVANVASARPAIEMLPTTTSFLANGNWTTESNHPAEFLPSSLTRCEHSRTGGLECLSKEIVGRMANTEIVYQTHATLSEIRANGEFSVTYRNNVLKIQRDLDPDNPDLRTQAGMHVGLGWQTTEHRLECRLDNTQTVHCVKNKTLNLIFKHRTAM